MAMKERTENELQKFNEQIEKDRAERKIAANKRVAERTCLQKRVRA